VTAGERERLEQLWAGEFGDAYVERNRAAGQRRLEFWREVVDRHGVDSALEIGCNIGGNLLPLAELIGAERLAGVDVNERALEILAEGAPSIDARRAAGAELPFPDRSFDLVFTMGVLIHQPDESLGAVMDEVVRCSQRLVLCGEYFADEPQTVPYHGESAALFKRDYGRLYRDRFPELRLVDEGHLTRDDGFDDVTWWLFERPAA
jgi:pseudaminic acid biosynthesis-associated methylase